MLQHVGRRRECQFESGLVLHLRRKPSHAVGRLSSYWGLTSVQAGPSGLRALPTEGGAASDERAASSGTGSAWPTNGSIVRFSHQSRSAPVRIWSRAPSRTQALPPIYGGIACCFSGPLVRFGPALVGCRVRKKIELILRRGHQVRIAPQRDLRGGMSENGLDPLDRRIRHTSAPFGSAPQSRSR